MLRKQHREYVTVQELAKRLYVSVWAAYKMLGRAEIPYYRFGGALRVKVEDLEKFIEASRHEAN